MWKKIIITIMSVTMLLLVGCGAKAIDLKEVKEYDKYMIGDLDGEIVDVEGKILHKTRLKGINYYSISYSSVEEFIYHSYCIVDYGDSSKLEGVAEGDYVKITNAKVNDTYWGDKIDTSGNLEKMERDILINSDKCKIEIIDKEDTE